MYTMQQPQIQLKASEEQLRGTYANMMQLLHTKEEFVLDFLNVIPPIATLNARIIVSPGHLKRMVRVLSNAIQAYEAKFGSIEEAKEQLASKEMGFAPKSDATVDSSPKTE